MLECIKTLANAKHILPILWIKIILATDQNHSDIAKMGLAFIKTTQT